MGVAWIWTSCHDAKEHTLFTPGVFVERERASSLSPPDLFRVWPVSLVLGKTICSALQNQIAAQFSSFSRLSYVK
jgi:hypothetical protein